MINEEFVEFYKERGSGALDQKMGIKILEAEQGRIVGTMPVEGNTQPMGLLHVSYTHLTPESLGSIGTSLHAGPHRKIVGVDINATHHKSAITGLVTGVATAISLGKTLCSWEIVITNEAGERTCTARITCLILAER